MKPGPRPRGCWKQRSGKKKTLTHPARGGKASGPAEGFRFRRLRKNEVIENSYGVLQMILDTFGGEKK
jgi:hypothetical protein